MARTWTSVRSLTEADWPRVHELWNDACAELPMGADVLSRQLSTEHLRATLDGPGVTTLVAACQDEPIGIVVLTASPLTALTSNASMTVEVLYVVPEHRGRGIGNLLLAKAAAVAEGLGVRTLASMAPATSRTANRYYAKLGFQAALTSRTVSTAMLRRRLATEGSPVDRVVARRRSLRAAAIAARQRSVETFTEGRAAV